MNNQFNEETKVNNDTDAEYVYKKVIDKNEKRRTVSILSLIFAILSVILLFIPWLSLISSLVSIVMGAFSRKNLGYFDRLTLAGLIIGIFGLVFSITGLFFGNIISFIF